MIVCYVAFGGMVVKYSLNNCIEWLVIAILLRFSLYSAIWGKVAYNDMSYLGDKARSDKFIKWLLYDKMEQGKDALLWLYIVAFLISIMIYLNLIFNSK